MRLSLPSMSSNPTIVTCPQLLSLPMSFNKPHSQVPPTSLQKKVGKSLQMKSPPLHLLPSLPPLSFMFYTPSSSAFPCHYTRSGTTLPSMNPPYFFFSSSFFFLLNSNLCFTWSSVDRSTRIDIPMLRWSVGAVDGVCDILECYHCSNKTTCEELVQLCVIFGF